MINALCIDLEPWYSAELIKKYVSNLDNFDDQIIESVSPILKLLDKYNTKATFAILGIVAEKYPQLVKDIFDQGHEIASHAYSHKTLYELGEKGFEEEIQKSVDLLETITGSKPKGFRAPSFSVNNSTKWAFMTLEKYGFKYDASIFPIKTNLYGVPRAPSYIYKPSFEDIAKDTVEGSIIEFPMSIYKCGINIPITGGFYFRTQPLWFIKRFLKKINEKKPAIIYLHPWEMYNGTPKLQHISKFHNFITYYGSGKPALDKFENLLIDFRFKPICEILKV